MQVKTSLAQWFFRVRFDKKTNVLWFSFWVPENCAQCNGRGLVRSFADNGAMACPDCDGGIVYCASGASQRVSSILTDRYWEVL